VVNMHGVHRLCKTACILSACILWAPTVGAHEISMPTPLDQPASPVKLKSCYLGTDFSFGDPKLLAEQTKMQLSAALAKPAPRKYRELGLRFEFGVAAGKRSADVIIFTGSEAYDSRDIMAAPPGLQPSGYLPRVPDYEDYRCAVDFATSLDRRDAWYDANGDVVPCGTPTIILDSSTIWLTALELQPQSTEAIFLMINSKQKGVFWRLGTGTTAFQSADVFGRSVVSIPTADKANQMLSYGSSADSVNQHICFRPFNPRP
jgi:hypothetical protein